MSLIRRTDQNNPLPFTGGEGGDVVESGAKHGGG